MLFERCVHPRGGRHYTASRSFDADAAAKEKPYVKVFIEGESGIHITKAFGGDKEQRGRVGIGRERIREREQKRAKHVNSKNIGYLGDLKNTA